jgi:hypothetical protein
MTPSNIGTVKLGPEKVHFQAMEFTEEAQTLAGLSDGLLVGVLSDASFFLDIQHLIDNPFVSTLDAPPPSPDTFFEVDHTMPSAFLVLPVAPPLVPPPSVEVSALSGLETSSIAPEQFYGEPQGLQEARAAPRLQESTYGLSLSNFKRAIASLSDEEKAIARRERRRFQNRGASRDLRRRRSQRSLQPTQLTHEELVRPMEMERSFSLLALTRTERSTDSLADTMLRC